jgi:mannose-6-phosphate isomerase
LGVSFQAAREAAHAVLYCFGEYPKDPGAVAPFFLSLLHLVPGQGLYIPAGVLHSYLKGTIIELMAASDNVIRGGMTSKKIDIDQLFNVLEPEAKPVLVAPESLSVMPGMVGNIKGAGNFEFWPVPTQEFALTRIEMDDDPSKANESESFDTTNLDLPGPKILFCTRGEALLRSQRVEAHLTDDSEGICEVRVRAGESVFAPDTCRNIAITGASCIYVASVPNQPDTDADTPRSK